MALSIEEVLALYRIEGAALYGGEAVTQLEHALQCAQLAERSGGSAELIAACLLHDVGHLVMTNAGKPAGDDVHQYVAMPFLRGVLPDAVLEPIRLHVDAKRYLCRAEQGYWDALSPASQRSLELQGGVFPADEARRFLSQRHAADAVRLRRLDDQAKIAGETTPPLAHYEALLRRLAL